MVNCYVNCIVQCLFSLPLFHTYLLKRVHSRKHSSHTIKERESCFLCAFERSCLRHMESDEPISLSWIVSNVSRLSKSLSSWEQEDAHEFLLGMLSRMELESAEVGRDPSGSDISRMFGGWMCKLSECSVCKSTKTLYERYSVLSVDVTDTTNTLCESIKSLIAPEQPSDYECTDCKKKTKATIRSMFLSYPPNLVIHLKRFMNDSSRKSSLHITFPEILDMRPFLLPSYAAPSKSDETSLAEARSINGSHFAYRLVGVVAHMGWTEFGHYVSYAANSCGEWLMYSDDVCRKVPFSEVEKAQAYILFYQQENMEFLGVPCFLADGPQSESAPCLGGCGMYGTKENSYYCSVCYKKYFPGGKK